MPQSTKRMSPPPHKPMTRDQFDAWREDLLVHDAMQKEMIDIKGFIADVKRFNPKAGDILEQINKLNDKLAEALK